LVTAVVGLTALGLGLLVAAPVSAANPNVELPVVPVHGQDVGNGVRLYVDVFYARGGAPGPPGGGGGPSLVNCTDGASSATASPFAFAKNDVLDMHLNAGTVPSGLNAGPAIQAAVNTWNAAGTTVGQSSLLSLTTGGTSETGPGQNGTSTIGFARLVPKNVLAATWTWVDGSNHIIEADLFFNTMNPWAVLGPCVQGTTTATGTFDVGDIATHELGHTLGLNHISDANAQATMYPSAPSDEVRKRTLTDGDIASLQVSVSG
jgi:hypothetical protein